MMDKKLKLQIKIVRIWYKEYSAFISKDFADINSINFDYETSNKEEFLLFMVADKHHLFEKIKLFERISLN